MRPLNISSSQVDEYCYEEDAWSSKEGESMWHGRMTEKMKLDGASHGVAADILFESSKSVSVFAFHVGDELAIEAHQKIVASIIKHFEKREK